MSKAAIGSVSRRQARARTTARASAPGRRPSFQFSISSRAGSTLVEVMTIIAVASVMMGVGVLMIHRLLGADQEAQKAARYALTVSRLARHWRDDVHAATTVDLPEEGPEGPSRLIATMADGRQIRYELDRHVAARLEDLGGDQTHRDDFYFPPCSQLQFSRDQDGLVRLEIEMPAGGPGPRARKTAREGAHRRLTIAAAPSRDHRFERSAP